MTLSLARVLHSRSRSPIMYFSLEQDPRIDGNLLKLGPEDHLLMLTTGGCNVLDRLLDGVGHIVSVDLNPSQNALLELRLAAARACTHEQFFQLFAHSKRRLFDALYPQTLRPLLSPSAQRFWDDNAGNFFDDFFYAGASGGLARILCWLTWLFGLQPLIRAFLTCKTVEEQAALCDAHEPKIARLIRCFDALLPAFCPLAGVPASQLRLATDDPEQTQSIIRVFLTRIFWKTHIAQDNYFYYAYLFGRYSRQCCPRYLRPENFEALKAAASRVTVKTALLHEAANEYPDGYFTGMILLDHMDWLSEEQIQQEWGVFSKKLHPEKGRVLWRSFAQQQRWPMLKFLNFNKAAVDKAEADTPDRVGMYNSTHLATMPPGTSICDPAPAPPLAEGAKIAERFATLRGVLAVFQLIPFIGGLIATMITALCGMLFAPSPMRQASEGRHSLLRLLPGISGGTWVDLGGGLSNFLRSAGEGVRMYSQVHTVKFGADGEPLPPTQITATQTVKLHEHVVPDASVNVAEAIGINPGSAEIVTLSHTLVAEADWEERLSLAKSLLAPGGYLAVVDLAQPPSVAPDASVIRKAFRAMRVVFWAAARPRGDAPYHSAVLSKLKTMTNEVHLEEVPAGSCVTKAPLMAPHFLYVGRV